MLPTQAIRSRAITFRRLTAAGRAGLLVVALSGLMVFRAAAGGRKPAARTPEYKQTYDVIKAVNAGAHTITIATMQKEVEVNHPNQGGNAKSTNGNGKAKSAKGDGSHETAAVTLKVNDFAEIEINGQKSSLGALKNGMKVDVTKGSDGTTADRLVATE